MATPEELRQAKSDAEVAAANASRPCRIWEVASGPLWWESVDLWEGSSVADFSGPIRTTLEAMKIEVRRLPIANERNAAALLAAPPTDATFVLMAIHGDGKNFIMNPEAGGASRVISPQDLAASTTFEGRHVLGLGCLTGAPAMVAAMEAAGAASYVAPVNMPYAHVVPIFVSMAFFGLAHGATWLDAVRQAAAFHGELGLWKVLLDRS